MYCMPFDDACNLQEQYVNDVAQISQQVADEWFDNSVGIDIGEFNGRKYSMITMDGKPVIVISETERPADPHSQFLFGE